MLLNLITLICAPVSYGFPSSKDNTVKKDSSPDGKSKITKELDKVTFVELRKNAAFYMEVDGNKDVVVAIGPWRQLAFIDNGAGSGVDETLRKMEHSEIGNLILVSAPGDGLFKDIMGSCEDDEEKEKAAESKPEPRKRQRQARRSDSAPKPIAERLPESTAVVIPPGSFDDAELVRQSTPKPVPKPAAILDVEEDDD